MTTPKIATFNRGGGRYYIHPKTGDKVPGVTSVLGMLPKPFLKAWAAKMVATEAVDGIEMVQHMISRDRDGAIDYLKRTPDRSTKQAADIGTAAHGIFEALALGEQVSGLTPELEPFAAHYRDFLDTVQPKFLATEDTVWSEKHGYAGSFDCLMEIEGQRCWGDNKTTKSGVYPEVALQLSAYSHADYIIDAATGDQHLLPAETGRGVVIHVRPEGWALYEVPIGDEVFEIFLHLRRVFHWDASMARTVVGKPVLKGAAKCI